MTQNPSETTVLVTGASGFIASHCIVQLLEQGYRVRGTLRSPARADDIRKAVAARVDPGDRLEFCTADLASDAGWADAVKGCTYVLHVASPFPKAAPKHEDELIIPARDGALRVLKAASDAGVRRVVMTSSLAAVAYGHPREKTNFSEQDWSIVENTRGAYEKSKTIAERAAWDFVASLPPDRKLELATINPGAVLGPVLEKDSGTSGELVRMLMKRELPGCPRLGFPMVDVRDVATAHLAAMTTPEAAGQRYCCSADFAWMKDIANILAPRFRDRGYKVPTRGLPDFLVRLSAIFDKTLAMVVPSLGERKNIATEKIRRELNWQPRSVEEMTVSMAESMIKHGVV
jgi:dihydroflavonol-4-reductase